MGSEEDESYRGLFRSSQKTLVIVQNENKRLKEELKKTTETAAVPCPGGNLFEAIDNLTSTLGEFIRKLNNLAADVDMDNDVMTERIANLERVVIHGFSKQESKFMELKEGLEELKNSVKPHETTSLKEKLDMLQAVDEFSDPESIASEDSNFNENYEENIQETRVSEITWSHAQPLPQEYWSAYEQPKVDTIVGEKHEPREEKLGNCENFPSLPTVRRKEKRPVSNKIAPAQLPAQYIVILGGCTAQKPAMDSILIYNLNKNVWTTSPQKLPMPLISHGAAYFNDKIYLFGGEKEGLSATDHLYRLNRSMKWDQHKQRLQTKRKEICNSCVTANGKVYILGGMTDYEVLNAVDTVACQDNKIVIAAYEPLSTPMTDTAAAFFSGGIYICGGTKERTRSKRNKVNFYKTSNKMVSCVPMPEARKGHCAVIYEKSLVVLGGEYNSKPMTSVQRLNWSSNAWEKLPAMLEARSHFGAAVCGNSIVVVGGIGRNKCQYLNTVEIFDGKRWKKAANMPVGLACFPLILLPEAKTEYLQKIIGIE